MFLLRDDINEIVGLVKAGKTLCFPTDTVWALGCDATNEAAVAAVRQMKGVPDTEGLVVLVDSIASLKKYVEELPPRIETLLALHQKPFSLVYPNPVGLAANLCAADGSVAIRVVQDPFCQQLIQLAGVPLVGTIAALHGEPAPQSYGSVSSDVLTGVDYVVKHRQDDKRTYTPSPMARLDQYQELDFFRE